ncbi:Annexin family protein [Pseudohyphozyma bogoriensis]|nr:Annexin family protein [Pseudohyphozyma bogoriensis]
MADLSEIFSQLPNAATAPDGTPAAPASELPHLIREYQARRAIELLSDEEMMALEAFATGPGGDMIIGVGELIQLLATLHAATPSSVVDSQPPPGGAGMLAPATADPASPSPAPRIRTTSLASTSSIPRPSTTSSLTSSPAKHKRRSFLTALSRSTGPSSTPEGQQDLSDAVTAAGATYLGVSLDGPLGPGWDATEHAKRLRAATKGVGTREAEVIKVLADKTYPQIRSIDKAYRAAYGKTLQELISSEKSVRGNSVQYALKGLIMGPLNFDVDLLKQGLEATVKNDNLLISLLIARPPSSLDLLRIAYSRKVPSAAKHKSLDAAVLAAYPNTSNAKVRKAFEIAFEGKWEDRTEDDDDGDGELDAKEFAERVKLMSADVDQLVVGLRGKGGNIDMISKIILARSPAHLHSVQVEYRKRTKMTLTKAVKQASTGTLEKILLYALETGKNDSDGPEVWRDAKLLYKTMEGVGTRNEALSWMLIRAHWDRPRFKRVQKCFQQKYKKSLLSMISDDTSGTFRELLRSIIISGDLPEPEATPEDVARLEAVGSRSRSSSFSSVSERGSIEAEHGELEGTGELSRPSSPRSPPPQLPDDEGDATPQLSSFPQFASMPNLNDDTSSPNTPGLPSSSSTFDLGASTASNSSTESGTFTKGHATSSSLSYRQRSAPLESFSHRPPSSAGGSLPKSFDKPTGASALRHSKPVAPRRMRASLDNGRPSSEEPTSPTPGGFFGSFNSSGQRSGATSPLFARSPTPGSGPSERAFSPTLDPPAVIKSRSNSGPTRRESSGGSGGGRASTEPAAIPISPSTSGNFTDVSSPPSSVDTTSYYAPPISPVGDHGPSASPPSAVPYAYDMSPMGQAINDFYAESTPEKGGSAFLRRDASTASMGSTGSRPGSLFFGEGFGSAGRPGSMMPGDQALLRQINELTKKLKDQEARNESSASAYEQEHSELEGRLEEARAELQVKRREEKELRSSEKQHLGQITALEADIAKLTRSLERSREQYETMKKNYQDQCAEAEKLRALVAETRRENRAAEEAAQVHTIQVQQFEQDREALQGTIAALESELAVAIKAEEVLNDQKQENRMLKETIDRLKFDMDELRSAGRKSMFLEGSTASPDKGDSIPASMSKSLGRELARRLAVAGSEDSTLEKDAEEEEEEEDPDADEEVDDIIVTTHRRVKKRGTARTTSSPSAPTVTHVEETTIVADADTQTDPILTTEMNVQTEISAVTVDLVPAPISDPPPYTPKTEREVQEELAAGLGIDVSKLEEFVKSQKRPRAQTPSESSLVRRQNRWASRISSRMSTAAQAPAFIISVFPDSAKPFVRTVLESSTTFMLYTLCIFLTGIVTGGVAQPFSQGHGPPFHMLITGTDRAYWHQANSFGHLWGEGLGGAGVAAGGGFVASLSYRLNQLIWGGVSVVRRIPV